MSLAARLATVSAEHAALVRTVNDLQQQLAQIVDRMSALTGRGRGVKSGVKPPPRSQQAAAHTSAQQGSATADERPRFIDIGANLTDPMFRGEYRGKQKHRADLNDVLDRGWDAGLDAIFVTGGSLSESEAAIKLCERDSRLFCTVGCHPTRCTEYKEGGSAYGAALEDLIQSHRGRVMAVGECGLDYDRLQFCDKETQLKYFEAQLQLAARVKLPLFLHCRAAGDDFCEVMRRHRPHVVGGVVHSFDGSAELAAELVAMGLYIGINGCSLKTADNLAVAAGIPASALMLETDAPWCEIRPTHAGITHVRTKLAMVKAEKFEGGKGVKNRNEPALIPQVLEVLAGIRKEQPLELAQIVLANTRTLFFSPTS
eukprot:m.32789 g.32789  ORF g.32789 m.32789 type:complete len:371 (+) comp7099_c0_seq1:170-1282(+)